MAQNKITQIKIFDEPTSDKKTAINPEINRRRVENKVALFASTTHLWDRRKRILLAVSGGADSLAMLFICNRLHCIGKLKSELFVGHLHHGMRGAEADSDQQYVADQCQSLGLEFIAGAANVPEIADQRRIGVEEAGRIARRSFLNETAARIHADSIATAHTQSDHVETILLHLIRGAGLHGLAGIPPEGFDDRIRPLLCLTRSDTESYCRLLNLAPRNDPTNQDLSYTRNKIRLTLLPLLRNEFNPAIDQALCRLADIVHENLLPIEKTAIDAVRAAITDIPGIYLRKPLRESPVPSECARHILELFQGSQNLQSADVDRLVHLFRKGGVATLSGGAKAEARGDTLRIWRQPSQSDADCPA